jgi:transcriptional regulator with XRE-family HTH domain
MAQASMASASNKPTALDDVGYSEKTMAQKGDRKLADRVRAHMRQLCDERKWSLYQLAGKIGVDASTLYKVFSGDRGIGIDLLFALHRGLHLPADQFLDDDPPDKYFHPLPDEGRRGRRPAAGAAAPSRPERVEAQPTEVAEVVEYFNAIEDPNRRAQAMAAVRKLIAGVKGERKRKSG